MTCGAGLTVRDEFAIDLREQAVSKGRDGLVYSSCAARLSTITRIWLTAIGTRERRPSWCAASLARRGRSRGPGPARSPNGCGVLLGAESACPAFEEVVEHVV
jgi:hypothetical protein